MCLLAEGPRRWVVAARSCRFDGQGIAASRGVGDPHAIVAAEQLPQRCHLHPEVGVLDVGVRPRGRDEHVVGDEVTCVSGEHLQEGKGTAADTDPLAILQQDRLIRKVSERPEPYSGISFAAIVSSWILSTDDCTEFPRGALRAHGVLSAISQG